MSMGTNLSFTSTFSTASPDCSCGKESACSAGDPGWIPGLGRSPGEGIRSPLQYSWASLVAQTIKNLPAMRDLVWITGLRSSPGGGHGNPLQYSCLANLVVGTAHGVIKNQT